MTTENQDNIIKKMLKYKASVLKCPCCEEISHMINKLEIEKDRDIDRLMVLRILNDINKEIEFLI